MRLSSLVLVLIAAITLRTLWVSRSWSKAVTVLAKSKMTGTQTSAAANDFLVPAAPKRKSVAVIGGGGNAGSFVTLKLMDSGLFESVVPMDMDPQLDAQVLQVVKKHSRDLTEQELLKYGTVIFLGGCTGRRACAALNSEERYKVQVEDVLDLVQKMQRHQLLIISSTSAVLEGQMDAHELNPVLESKLDEYSSSMWQREEALQKLATSLGASLPRINVLRFGTLLGVSPGQRTDLLVPSLFRSAYTKGVLSVSGSLTHRSFLGLDDLARAVQTLITAPKSDGAGRFHIWNLASFNATILKMANTVASLTEATVDVQDALLDAHQPTTGFTLDCKKFQHAFNFTFRETILSTLQQFDETVPDSITPKGPHAALIMKQEQAMSTEKTIPCPVCNATGQQTVLDLGRQPFANDFLPETNKALSSPRFPLKLVRCRVCNHYHLSHVASREDLFEQYLYRSGTSRTLQEYFEWLANKITRETKQQRGGGNVLELACNDGSQLDQFRKLGWNTFGVDPAKNIATIAQKKGHSVKNGFWPLDFPELPRGNKLHAIVAQNVLAHVPYPADFLKACANVMGPKTRLYIQTSQCNMQQLGQFDTMYHEHISFFTGHSFVKAADLAGLYITSFETTPIHGESCLVTMELDDDHKNDPVSKTMAERLALEVKDGVTTEFFGDKFTARAHSIRDWMATEVASLKQRNFVVGAYGAAAKGMTLLHFILDGAARSGDKNGGSDNLFDWVLDDAPLKQDKYCPGTTIPVRPTDSLANIDSSRPLAIVVLAWNFLDEIVKNIIDKVKGKWDRIFVLAPFPTPRMFLVMPNTKEKIFIREMTYNPTPIPNPVRTKDRKQVSLVTHQRNEELLMPYFIIQHAPLFDRVILIDFKSTDRTKELINLYAPPSWEVVASRTGNAFDANELDVHVQDLEMENPNQWHLALTTTEHLVYPELRRSLYGMQKEHAPNGGEFRAIIDLKMLMMIGDDDKNPLMHYTSLMKQRHVFGSQFLVGGAGYARGRQLHIGTSNHYVYRPGRHGYKPSTSTKVLTTVLPMSFRVDRQNSTAGVILKYQYTPYPENVERFTSVGLTIPQEDREAGRGSQHLARASKDLVDKEREGLSSIPAHDLCNDQGDLEFLDYRRAFRSFPVDCR